MGTVKRLNERQEQLKDAENAMPGAYENRYAGDIAGALAAIGSQNAQGFGADAANSGYQSAVGRLNRNAQAGADAAAATAQALSGGYGAQWADSAANQAAAGQTGQTAGLMASARADALSQWQRELSGQNSLLDTLLGQNALERSEYDGSVANAADWRSYLSGRTEQARQENSDFWGNVWNAVTGGVDILRQGYDAYKGYSQQKLANQSAGYQMAMEAFDAGDPERARQIMKMYDLDETMVDAWGESSSMKQNKVKVWQQVQSFLESGNEAAARATLDLYGMDTGMVDTWNGLSDTDKEMISGIVSASGLAGNGDETGAGSILKILGLDTGSVDSYSTIANRVNQAAMAKYAGQQAISNRYKTTGSSSSSGTGSGIGYSSSNVTSLMNKLAGLDQKDPMYSVIAGELQRAGVDMSSILNADSESQSAAAPTSTQSGSGQRSVNTGSAAGTGGTTSRLPSGTKYPWQTMGTADAVAGASEKVGSAKNGDFDTAVSRAQSMANSGYSMSQIAEYLIRMGYSDNVISRVSNVMGW